MFLLQSLPYFELLSPLLVVLFVIGEEGEEYQIEEMEVVEELGKLVFEKENVVEKVEVLERHEVDNVVEVMVEVV